MKHRQPLKEISKPWVKNIVAFAKLIIALFKTNFKIQYCDRNKGNEINLTDRSKLLIRLPSAKVPFVYSFGGKSLIIGKHKIRLGIPEMNFLQPKSRSAIAYCGYQRV